MKTQIPTTAIHPQISQTDNPTSHKEVESPQTTTNDAPTDAPTDAPPTVSQPPVEPGKPKSNKILLFGAVLLLITIIGTTVHLFSQSRNKQTPQPVTYEECVNAQRSVIQESYPATCVTKDGNRFIQPLTEEESKNMSDCEEGFAPLYEGGIFGGCVVDTSNWKTYTGNIFQFSVKHPPVWENRQLEESVVEEFGNQWPSGITTFAIHSTDSDKDVSGSVIEGTSLSVIIYRSSEYTIDKIMDTVDRENYLESVYSIDSIKGRLFLDNTTPPVFRNSNRKILFIEKGDLIYGIQLVWSKNTPERERVLDKVLSTFKFFDESSKVSGCFPKFDVESDTPELSASQAYSQECLQAVTQIECELVDIYHASSGNFGNEDGIPDCQWVE